MSRLPAGIPRPTPPGDRHAQAMAVVQAAPGKADRPWQAPNVRDDLRVTLHTRQPERLMLQVEWLMHVQGRSKVEFVETALRELVKREFERMGVEE